MKNQSLYYVTPVMLLHMGASNHFMCKVIQTFNVGRRQRIVLDHQNQQRFGDIIDRSVVNSIILHTAPAILLRLRKKKHYTRAMRFRSAWAELYFDKGASEVSRLMTYIELIHRFSRPVRPYTRS